MPSVPPAATNAQPPTPYPPTLTEVERLEIAHALGYHFDACPAEYTEQYDLLCSVIDRMLGRRAGVI